MMEVNANSYDVDLEDGELSASSEEVYKPLQRPTTNAATNLGGIVKRQSCSPLADCHQMQQALEEEADREEDINSSSYSSSGESTDDCLKKLAVANDGVAVGQTQQRKRKKRIRRTVMVRVQPTDAETQEKRARFKKYNIWTADLQEEALTENMRGCDVTRNNGTNDRNVENYDFSLKRRLNGENCLKRRLSNSTDDFSDGDSLPAAKRGRPSSRGPYEVSSQRRSVRSRLGHRSRPQRNRRGSSPTSGSDNSNGPRTIADLDEVGQRKPEEIAEEIAVKLYEEKDELIIRCVEVLGIALPMEIYKETQRIESEGGMMIMNGKRRRTPGGVFLFLLKHNESLTAEQRKSIFSEEQKNAIKRQKDMQAMLRDQKVEELKKRLNEQEKELSALSTRKDHFLLGSELSHENQAGNLSNPPPSPVGNEQSPDYKTHAINHVASDASPDKPSTSASALAALASSLTKQQTLSPTKDLVSYDDDFLDVNCSEMDFF